MIKEECFAFAQPKIQSKLCVKASEGTTDSIVFLLYGIYFFGLGCEIYKNIDVYFYYFFLFVVIWIFKHLLKLAQDSRAS